jgi:hypothetical protein
MDVDTAVVDVYEGHGPECEHFSTCPNKCYVYEYAYGHTTFEIPIRGHLFRFGWVYSDPQHIIKAECAAVDLVVKAAQKCQLEDLHKDKRRLDWLEKDPFENMEAIEWRIRRWHDTVRSSIDYHEDKAGRSQESN